MQHDSVSVTTWVRVAKKLPNRDTPYDVMLTALVLFASVNMNWSRTKHNNGSFVFLGLN